MRGEDEEGKLKPRERETEQKDCSGCPWACARGGGEFTGTAVAAGLGDVVIVFGLTAFVVGYFAVESRLFWLGFESWRWLGGLGGAALC